jgi:peptidyl-prolyl cis-trans isomerase C
MKKSLIIFLTLFLFACNNQSQQVLPKSDIVAIVGEEKVTIDMLNAFLTSKGVTEADDALLKKALDSLVGEVAIANIAKKKNLELTREQLNSIHYLQVQFMAENARKDYLSGKPISEEEIVAEYNQAQQQTGGKQYHIHHLLFQDEIQAIKQREIIFSIEDYINVEQQYLQTNKGMKNVGDIGWVSLSQLPKGFKDVVPTMVENSVLADVVNTEFGAHIVYLKGIRDLQPPKLEEVKPGIIKALQAKKLSQFTQLARAKAHVEIKK